MVIDILTLAVSGAISKSPLVDKLVCLRTRTAIIIVTATRVRKNPRTLLFPSQASAAVSIRPLLEYTS